LAVSVFVAVFVWALSWFGPAPIQNAASPNPHTSAASTAEPRASSSQGYVGDSACRSCHEEESNAYSETSHHLTSRLPSQQSIAGKFSSGANVLRTSNPDLTFEMSATKDGYFETAVEKQEKLALSKTNSHTERIDLVIGSGRKGQSYLFWKEDTLFELPVSYWTELDNWINSPGYPDGAPHFDKAVVPRCLECHASYFGWVPPPLNRYDKATLILGITCEKCHGPGREHVALYRAKNAPHPGTSTAILNPASFPRDRQISACALCHAGAAKAKGPPLSFVPGEPIDQYLFIPYPDKNMPVDVHGNQIQLMATSRCFQSSPMTCTTCHNVHKPQRDAAAFSEHCLSCHKAEACGRFPQRGASIAKNCIDCHMPVQESEALVSDTNGRKLKPLVRNHRIGIYPAESVH
jgi:hypothetical protein